MYPLTFDLTDKVVVITGGAGVLGSSFSRACAQAGAKVVILGRSLEKASKLKDEIAKSGYHALAVSADVLNKESIEQAKEIVNQVFGPVDILINAAGGNDLKATTKDEYFNEETVLKNEDMHFFNMDLNGFDYVFGLNFQGTLIPSQVFMKDMIGKEGCSVLNISSMSSYNPLTKVAAYSAAKAAINNFTQWMAVHFAQAGIRVNAMAPGFFVTEQNKNLLVNADGTLTPRSHKIIEATPMKRFGEPDELVGTLLYLIDPKQSKFVTGIVVPVDGGFSSYSGV
ncbi:D-mannonate oxidoreductase [Paracholeplasma brassicae]|uniref:D-mannonate oxidoreductase n=1 Tax=Acholeplasma brassicae TaxID=61635 RepID=U4KSE3_9MOLU|nr:SDR family oxidoreductase [Paracholeplasma brassicae]CCV66578.1 D-mannonate oxidoreductase [Paracholeplasma brassicae]